MSSSANSQVKLKQLLKSPLIDFISPISPISKISHRDLPSTNSQKSTNGDIKRHN